jgi:hypothetical protein
MGLAGTGGEDDGDDEAVAITGGVAAGRGRVVRVESLGAIKGAPEAPMLDEVRHGCLSLSSMGKQATVPPERA